MRLKLLTLLAVSVAISLFMVYPTDALGINTLKNVINFTGTYPAGVESHEVTLSTPITNVSKAFTFITFAHSTDNDPSDSNRSWELVDNVFTLFKTITINSTEVDEDITLYPHLLNITDTDLRDDALASGDDIIFTNNAGTIQFPHEIEDYDGTTGALVAWIGVPNVSNATDTTYRMWYSNAGATNSENATGVWDSDFDMVMHLHDDFLDSTINSNDGASTNTINAVVKSTLADGELWDGAGDRIEVTDDPTLDNLSGWTISTWISRLTSDEDDSGIVMKSGNDDPEWTNSYGIAQVAQTNEICAWAVASETEQICFTPAEVFNETYLVVTSNGTDLTLYSNGTEITTGNFTGTPVVNDGDLLIGKGQAGGMGANNDFVWDGNMDEVRVSGIARSSDYITTTYCDQLGNDLCPFDSVGSETSGEAFDLGIKIRINGGSATPADNDAVDFVGYVVEYTNDSDMFVQHESFTFGASTAEGEKFNKLPVAVNTSSTMILASGVDYDGNNAGYGTEEFGRWRLVNSTDWGYSVDDTPATGDNNVFAQIVDWNVDTVLVQTGNATILDGGNVTIQITPPTVVQPNQTIFISSFDTDGDTSEQTNRLTHLGFLQANGDMIFNRDSANFNNVFEWQLIEFLDSDMFVIHNSTCTAFGTLPECDEAGAKIASGDLTFNMPIPTTNTTSSFAISPLMSPFGYSSGRGEGGDDGRLDNTMVTMELTSPTNILMTRGDDSLDASFGFEVITWGDIQGGTQNLTQNIIDVVSAVDTSQDLSINGTQIDTAQILDEIDLTAIFVVNLNDDGTTSDVVQFNITKLFSDGVPIFDDPQFDIIKTLSELAVVNDSVFTNVTTISDEGILDTVISSDLIILNITKQFSDTVDVSDSVDITRILRVLLDDTATVNDPSVLFTITATPAPISGSGGGGGGTPTPQFERLVGLGIESELIHVQPRDTINSDFIITYFGSDTNAVTLTDITIEDGFFSSWLTFSPIPDSLAFEQTIDASRTTSDPARYVNIALDDFVVVAPPRSCAEIDIFDEVQDCIDPLIYEVPLEFEFTKNGVKFHADHQLLIDARVQDVSCNIFIGLPEVICDSVDFIINYWFWILLIFGVSYFLYLIMPRALNKTRVTKKVHRKDLESMSDRKVKLKFKRGRR